jgi:FkbM family methyltransferase
VDLSWLKRNIVAAWRHRGGLVAFFVRLLFVYSDLLPKFARQDKWVIAFNYPQPIGSLRLLLRTNKGSDGFIHGEVFEHNYYHIELPFEPNTILDLGANIGMTAIYFHRCFPSAALACVEPMPGNLEILQENLRLNAPNATIISGAVNSTDGRLVMEVARKDYGHRVARPGETPGERQVEVAAFCVPTLLAMLKWDRIGLLKIDIEGHERILLSENASWLSLVDSICIECHDGFGPNDLRRLTERFGFLPPERLPGIWLVRRSSGIRSRERIFPNIAAV